MSIAWMAQGIGGVAGNTKYSYLVMSVMGLVLALNGMYISDECEQTGSEDN